jgi:serine/threonine-protein kinase
MAPEMVTGGTIDARTDVYLLGATLHQILSGKPRHEGDGVRETLAAATRSGPIAYPSTVPAALADLANAATARDPSARPTSAAELRRGVVDYLRHKSSITLAESARERVARLRELAAATALGDEGGQRAIDLLVAEARFALKEAAGQWPDNPIAASASDDLEACLASRRTHLADLERLAREHDPVVADRQRALALVVLAAVALALSVFGMIRGGDVTSRALLFESLVPLGVTPLLFLVFRKDLTRNEINRRSVALFAVTVVGITLSRGIGVVAGAPASQLLAHDALLTALFATIGALSLFRWIAWTVPGLVVAAAIGAAAPEYAAAGFYIASGAAFVIAATFAWRTVGRVAR